MQQPFLDRRQPHSRRMQPNQHPRHAYYQRRDGYRRMRGTPAPPVSPYQQQSFTSKTGFIKKAFTSEDGSFDVSRTAKTVDQVIKTVQQVSPYVQKVGSFFIK